MKSSARKVELASAADLFSTEQERQDAKLEKVQNIPLSELYPFPDHPFSAPTTQKVILHGGESKTVTFQNEPLNGIVVEKYDSVTHEALPGCTFQLRYLGGTSGTGGTVIGQKVTGKNGTCIWTGLKSGTYIVEEVDPADGYSIINASGVLFVL